jgi:hypothetical protein
VDRPGPALAGRRNPVHAQRGGLARRIRRLSVHRAETNTCLGHHPTPQATLDWGGRRGPSPRSCGGDGSHHFAGNGRHRPLAAAAEPAPTPPHGAGLRGMDLVTQSPTTDSSRAATSRWTSKSSRPDGFTRRLLFRGLRRSLGDSICSTPESEQDRVLSGHGAEKQAPAISGSMIGSASASLCRYRSPFPGALPGTSMICVRCNCIAPRAVRYDFSADL